MPQNDPTRSCYNCDANVSVYVSACSTCGAILEAEQRPAAPNPKPKAQPKPAKSTRAWLAQIGMASYINAFEENAVTFDMLDELTDEDLKSIGVKKLGDRKTILRATGSLGTAPAAKDTSDQWVHKVPEPAARPTATQGKASPPQKVHRATATPMDQKGPSSRYFKIAGFLTVAAIAANMFIRSESGLGPLHPTNWPILALSVGVFAVPHFFFSKLRPKAVPFFGALCSAMLFAVFVLTMAVAYVDVDVGGGSSMTCREKCWDTYEGRSGMTNCYKSCDIQQCGYPGCCGTSCR